MDSFEQKYCIGTSDGTKKILWNITELLRDLHKMKFPVINYEVSKLSESNNFFGNPEHVMKTNIDILCIIVKLNDDIEKLIDGNHRLYKAKQLNLNDIPCYVLTADYHKNFIIDYDEDIYNDVIAEFT